MIITLIPATFCVCHDVGLNDLTMKDWCHAYTFLNIDLYRSRTHDVIDYVTRSKGQTLKLPQLNKFLSYVVKQKIVKMCGSRDIFLIHPSFGLGFGSKDCQRSKIEAFFGSLQNLFLFQIWKLDGKWCETKPFWPPWRHQWRHSATLNIAIYIHV